MRWREVLALGCPSCGEDLTDEGVCLDCGASLLEEDPLDDDEGWYFDPVQVVDVELPPFEVPAGVAVAP